MTVRPPVMEELKKLDRRLDESEHFTHSLTIEENTVTVNNVQIGRFYF